MPRIDVLDQATLQDGRVRIVGIDEHSKVHVATMDKGATEATLELSFDLGTAHGLAVACLRGDARAMTQPGLARILSASVAVLSRVAYQAGALRVRGHDPDNPDD